LKKYWCIGKRPSAEFVAAMEDVLEVYHRPYNAKKPLICLDEASKQLITETRKPIAIAPGRIKRVDSEYSRRGTASVFMINEPLTGQRYVRVRPQRRRVDFAEVIKELCDDLYADAERIVLVMDNLNTHSIASLYSRFDPAEARRLAEKLEIHFTPKHGSWLNMAEIELSVLARQSMNDYFDSIEKLRNRIESWQHKRNACQRGINWQFTTADARVKLRKLYPTI